MLKRFEAAKRVIAVSVLLFLAIMVIAGVSVVNAAEESDAKEQPPRIHAVSDLGHQFSFYADGRFHGQYLPGQPMATSWGALYNFDFSNANMLILLGCENRLKYLPKDIKTIGKLLNEGGGVVLFGQGGDNPQNKLAARMGCEFKDNAKKPLKAVSEEITGDIQGGGQWMELKKGQRWEVLIADADGKPSRIN